MYKYVWFIKPCKSVKFRPKFDELKLPMFRWQYIDIMAWGIDWYGRWIMEILVV